MKYKILFLTLLVPFLLFSQEIIQNEIFNKDENTNSVEEHLKKQELSAQETIKKINEEIYLKDDFSGKDYEKRINYLSNKITINKRLNNALAVKRDEIKLILLKEERFFLNTLREIIDAKKSFKDKEYFINVLKNNINLLENSSLEKFDSLNQIDKDNKVAKEVIKNYQELVNRRVQQLYTLKYMLENMNLYRKTNFLIDEFNLRYIIKKIDTEPILSPITKFTSYYLKFTIGEITVVLLILLFIRLLNKKIIIFFISFLNKLFLKRYLKKALNTEDIDDDVKQYIKKSIERPLVLALYLLSIHLSLYILIKDANIINKITPWINTIYVALFTWAIYSLLSNSITNFAQHLVERYPNLRREMIIFILKMLRIIFALFVILYLFTQLGIDIKAIAASIGVGGIAIALASKDTLANFFGSLNIMTDNSFSQGDWIIANDVEGTVVDIRMRTTRIRTFDNAMITIPNSELANTNIKNYSKRKIGRRIKLKIGITYESHMKDIVKLKDDIHEMLETHPDIATVKNSVQSKSKKFEAIKREDLQGVKRTLLVFIDEYANSSINILVYCFSRSPVWEDWLSVKEDVIVKINELVKKNNCNFAYPTQTLFLKK